MVNNSECIVDVHQIPLGILPQIEIDSIDNMIVEEIQDGIMIP
jgi:hypothetical protein